MLFDRLEDAVGWIALLFLATGLSLGMFGGYWTRGQFPTPHLIILVAPIAVFIRMSLWRRSFVREADNILLGHDGERVVADCLDELRAHGYRIFHDIPSQRDVGANVDHLAIGPGGIFVIETKTRRKPTGRDARVTFDGETLLIDGYVPDRDPIGQVCAVSREIGEWLRLDTGQEVASLIKPVVVFPGWYVADPRRIRDRPIWVLNDRALNKIIRKEDERLSPGDIALFSSRIEQRVRRHQAEALRRP